MLAWTILVLFSFVFFFRRLLTLESLAIPGWSFSRAIASPDFKLSFFPSFFSSVVSCKTSDTYRLCYHSSTVRRFVSVLTLMQADGSGSFMSAALIATRRKTFACLASLRWEGCWDSWKSEVGRAAAERQISKPYGWTRGVRSRRRCVCRSAAAHSLRINRMFVSEAGARSSRNLTPRPLLNPACFF